MILHTPRLASIALVLCLAGGLSVSHADPLPVEQQETVMLHQFCLVALGYDPGPTDGQIGPKTRTAFDQALREYATANGFEAVRQPDRAMVAFLQSCGKRLLHVIFVKEQEQLEKKAAAGMVPPQGWAQPLYDPLRR
jgi:hypothetical protein